MKNKVSGSGDSIFKKKGFFIALYSCLGAVMVLALVISFTNLMTGPGDGKTAQREEPPSVNVNADQVESLESILARAEAEAEEDEQAWRMPTAKPKATTAPASPAVTPAPPVPTTRPSVPIPAATPAPTPAPPAPATPAPSAPSSAQESDSGDTEALAFSPFEESDQMIWPVYGDIAMVFSQDKLVYDPTLDQYRTNDDLRIAAQEGTPVKACADGQVVAIESSQEYGNSVTVDHGNGWTTIYGQLMEGVLVEEGEVVKAGQVIGGVGKPSTFGSLNGTHVNLRVMKEDEAVDPRSLLVEGQ